MIDFMVFLKGFVFVPAGSCNEDPLPNFTPSFRKSPRRQEIGGTPVIVSVFAFSTPYFPVRFEFKVSQEFHSVDL
jgi:hypothetical protein